MIHVRIKNQIFVEIKFITSMVGGTYIQIIKHYELVQLSEFAAYRWQSSIGAHYLQKYWKNYFNFAKRPWMLFRLIIKNDKHDAHTPSWTIFFSRHKIAVTCESQLQKFTELLSFAQNLLCQNFPSQFLWWHPAELSKL